MSATMRKQPSRAKTVRSRRAFDANERAQRNTLIVRLYQEGEEPGTLATLTGLSVDQVKRILVDSGTVTESGSDDSSLLTSAELRQCRRENATSPEAIAWLANQRTDCRHNGKPMPRLMTNVDSIDDTADVEADVN